MNKEDMKEDILLEDINVEKCFKPKKFGEVREYGLHHFSDASE